jgi:penicillin-binding protein 1A
MPPDKRFTDRAVEIPLPNGTVWRPADGSEPSGEQLTARDGFIYSKNTITAQVMQEVGPQKTAQLARRMGVVESKLEEVPSLALGTSPVTLLEMVSAYATIAALGNYHHPLYATRVTDRNGTVLADFASEPRPALLRQTVGNLINMLRGAVDKGTGQPLRTAFGVRGDVGGKTGTTQKNTDGWFILVHPRLVVGAWVGFNDARVTMRSNYWGEGAHSALPIVADFFQQASAAHLIDSRAEFPFPRPSEPVFEPLFEQARGWFGGLMDRIFGSGPPPPRRTPR